MAGERAVVVQWRGERGEKARRKWEATVVAAAKQSRRARVPVRRAELADHGWRWPTRVAAAARWPTCCTRTRPRPLAGVRAARPAGDVLVVVGPEGGIAPERARGFGRPAPSPVRLGATVLRSSSAGPAALAVLSARGRWR